MNTQASEAVDTPADEGPIGGSTTATPAAAPRACSAGEIAVVASSAAIAVEARERLISRWGDCPLDKAKVVVALGGDGFMLETIHRVLARKLPVYGMNRGSVGFLMNPYNEEELFERIARAQAAELYPLRMCAVTRTGAVEEGLAFNEVSLLRQIRQSAKIRITIDGRVRLAELSCDGVLISTPAGSTAYNLSAHGPIVPLSANLLPLTPISAFRPRRWRGALLPSTAEVLFEVLESDKRPVAAVADFTEVRDVVSVGVSEDRSVSVTLLFDPDQGLSERIIAEQFTV
ncbi:MAG: NAD kinase [Rhodospirillales bacterium]|mgnify:FL=1|nr:NAD kinase [Rhodospirillales bacterium]MBN8927534.1 NAD kinase [Rhodospirillales bacterium]